MFVLLWFFCFCDFVLDRGDRCLSFQSRQNSFLSGISICEEYGLSTTCSLLLLRVRRAYGDDDISIPFHYVLLQRDWESRVLLSKHAGHSFLDVMIIILEGLLSFTSFHIKGDTLLVLCGLCWRKQRLLLYREKSKEKELRNNGWTKCNFASKSSLRHSKSLIQRRKRLSCKRAMLLFSVENLDKRFGEVLSVSFWSKERRLNREEEWLKSRQEMREKRSRASIT